MHVLALACFPRPSAVDDNKDKPAKVASAKPATIRPGSFQAPRITSQQRSSSAMTATKAATAAASRGHQRERERTKLIINGTSARSPAGQPPTPSPTPTCFYNNWVGLINTPLSFQVPKLYLTPKNECTLQKDKNTNIFFF